MSEISEFEARITAALERIGRAVAVAEESGGGAAASEQIAALTEELENERAASAKLEERVKAIQDRQETHVAGLEQEVEALRRQLMDHDRAMQNLRQINEELRANNAALREANAQGVGDADLINAGMQDELEALKSLRTADATELSAILTELRAVVARREPAPVADDTQVPSGEV